MLCKSFKKVNNNNNNNNNNKTSTSGTKKRQVSLTSVSSAALTTPTIFQINCSVCGLKSSRTTAFVHKLDQGPQPTPKSSASRSANQKLIKNTQLEASKHTVVSDKDKDSKRVNRSSSLKKKQHSSTSFSLKFHKFSFASPYLKSKFDYSSKNKSLSHKILSKISSKPMSQKKLNQRCCLAVSIVPFDKPGSKASADAKKNGKNGKKTVTSDNTDDEIYTKEIKDQKNDKSNSKSADSKQKAEKSPSNLTSSNNPANSNSTDLQASAVNPTTSQQALDNLSHKSDLISLNSRSSKQLDVADDKARSSRGSSICKELNDGNDPAAETKSTQSNSTLVKAQDSINIIQDVITVQIPSDKEVWTPSDDKKPVERNSTDRHSIDRHSTSSASDSLCKSSKSSSSGSESKVVKPPVIEPAEPVERRLSASGNTNDRRISVSSNCDSVCSEKVKTSGSERSAPYTKLQGESFNDFSLRINKLKFIDESASSTALQSPAESMMHINAHFGPTRGQVFQHTHLNNYNVDRLASKNGSDSASGGRLVNHRLSKIQRQANVRSSSDTWCSDDSKSASHVLSNLSTEMLERKPSTSSASASNTLVDSSRTANSHVLERIAESNGQIDSVRKTTRNGLSMQQDTEDDEEIKNIIMNNLLQKVKNGTNKTHRRFKSNKLAPNKLNHNQYYLPIQMCNSHSSVAKSSHKSHNGYSEHHHHGHHHHHKNRISTTSSDTSSTITIDSSSSCECDSMAENCARNRDRTPEIDSSDAYDNQPYDKYSKSKMRVCKYCHNRMKRKANKPATRHETKAQPFLINRLPASKPGKLPHHCEEDDSFDHLNECLDNLKMEPEDMQDKEVQKKVRISIEKESELEEVKDEYEEDEKYVTSILVEDGFIRMSSPVQTEPICEIKQKEYEENENLDDLYDINLVRAMENSCFIGSNRGNFGEPAAGPSSEKGGAKPITNFPNVGSSPISIEFYSSDSSSDNDEPVKGGKQHDDLNAKRDELLDHESLQDKTLSATSDDDENEHPLDVLENLDTNEIHGSEESLNHVVPAASYAPPPPPSVSTSKRNSILKQNNVQMSDHPASETTITHEVVYQQMREVSHAGSESKATMSTNVHLTTSKTFESEYGKSSVISSVEQQQQIVDHQIHSHQAQAASNPASSLRQSSQETPVAAARPSSSSHRPKVRFNLDINYEKEREWHRFSSKISDASKTPIEWTQEEVV